MEEEWRRSSKCEGCSYSVCVCMGQRLTDRHAQRERERERVLSECQSIYLHGWCVRVHMCEHTFLRNIARVRPASICVPRISACVHVCTHAGDYLHQGAYELARTRAHAVVAACAHSHKYQVWAHTYIHAPNGCAHQYTRANSCRCLCEIMYKHRRIHTLTLFIQKTLL